MSQRHHDTLIACYSDSRKEVAVAGYEHDFGHEVFRTQEDNIRSQQYVHLLLFKDLAAILAGSTESQASLPHQEPWRALDGVEELLHAAKSSRLLWCGVGGLVGETVIVVGSKQVPVAIQGVSERPVVQMSEIGQNMVEIATVNEDCYALRHAREHSRESKTRPRNCFQRRGAYTNLRLVCSSSTRES